MYLKSRIKFPRNPVITVIVVAAAVLCFAGLLQADGSLDSSFNGTGYVTHDINGSENGYSLALDGFGNYVVGGNTSPDPSPSEWDAAIWRYKDDGTLDTSFNTVGYVTFDGGTGDDQIRSIAIDASGNIVAAGWSSNGTNTDAAIWRYKSDGTLDTLFNGVGYVTHNSAAGGNSDDYIYSIDIDAFGNIVAAGSSSNGVDNDSAIWRFKDDGTLDTLFNGVGFVTHDNAAGGGGSDVISFLKMDALGNIVAAGYSWGTAEDAAIWRYKPDGTLDASFNSIGIVTYDSTVYTAKYDRVNSFVLDASGNIIVAGRASTPTSYYYDIRRFYPDGTHDTSFVEHSGFPGYTSAMYYPTIIADDSGRYITSGLVKNFFSYMTVNLERFNDDGSFDNSFGEEGFSSFDGGGNLDDYIFSSALDGFGNIISVGKADYASSNDYDMLIMRHKNFGLKWDKSRVTTSESGLQDTFSVNLTKQPNGDVVVDLSSSDLTESTVSPSMLIFNSTNWAGLQTVTVTGVNDDIDDGDVMREIDIMINSVATTDTTGYAYIDPYGVSVLNKDNDTAGIMLGAISGDTSENGDQATFTVRLKTRPLGDVSLNLMSITPQYSPAKGTVSPSVMIFNSTNWAGLQTATVAGIDDDSRIDGTVPYDIRVSGTMPDRTQMWETITVNSLDNDSAGVVVSPVSGNTSEDGSAATFSVKLTSRPYNWVTIPVSSLDTSEGTVSSSFLTLRYDDWDSGKIITVTGVDDSDKDGNILYQIQLLPVSYSSKDTAYDGIDPPDVDVINIDDETVGFTVEVIDEYSSENGDVASFTIRLNSAPNDDVALDITSLSMDEGVILTPILIFNTSNWNTPQTVTVSGVNDSVYDGNVQYYVSVEVNAALTKDTSGYAVIAPPPKSSFINMDNDINVSEYKSEKDIGSSSGGGGCFIATAAYGSYMDSDVMALRKFRDEVLFNSEVGRMLVDAYYAYSPPVADFIASHPALRVATRISLEPIVYSIKYPLLPIVFIVAGGGCYTVRRKKKLK